MRRHLNNNRIGRLQVLVIGIAWIVLMCWGPAWGIDSPGLVVNIYADENNPDLTIPLGQPVKLIMVIKNKTNFAVHTERGFSKLEPHRYLRLFDPAGNQHVVQADVMSGDAPAPFFIGKQITVPAEKIPANWVKSESIVDLTELFPVMKQTVGWYTLRANMPFMQILFTLNDSQLGLLGIIDSEDSDAATQNYEGTLDSNIVQIQITLPENQRGARLDVQILDQSTQPPRPLNSIPVRVYENSSMGGLTPAQAWAQGPGFAALTGSSDDSGTVVWDKDLCLLEKDYTAIAYYQNEYKAVLFGQGETGWTAQCDGILAKSIYFGEPPDKIVLVTGSAFNFPESVYIASFAMDISENADLSGWLKYYYTKTRLSFLSTAITEITASGTEAVIKGSGTANGVAGYSFEASVIDGNPDTFGLIIKEAGDAVYYNASIKNTNGGDLKVTVEVLAAPCEGDSDGDRDVDGKDLNVFRADYGRTNCSDQTPCPSGFGGDGDVDVEDLSTFTEDYGRVDCPQKP